MPRLITKHDIVIENSNGISIIPAGTKLIKENTHHEPIKPEEHELFNSFHDVLFNSITPDKLTVVKKELKEGYDEVEGTQTDVDDFDVHRVETLYGKVVFELSIPKELIPIKFSAADSANESSQIDRFVALADIPSFDDIKEVLADVADIRLWGKHDRDSDESTINSYVSQKTTDDVLVIGIVWNVNIQGSADSSSLVHKGRYRTGGRYPDA